MTEMNHRSYVVQTPDGIYRRNHRHLLPLPQPVSNDTNNGVTLPEGVRSTDTTATPNPSETNSDDSIICHTKWTDIETSGQIVTETVDPTWKGRCSSMAVVVCIVACILRLVL